MGHALSTTAASSDTQALRRAYRSLRRVIGAYDGDGLPLFGALRGGRPILMVDPVRALQEAFRRGSLPDPTGAAEQAAADCAADLLRRRRVLLQADPPARQALRYWREMQRRLALALFTAKRQGRPYAEVEAAALALPSLVIPPAAEEDGAAEEAEAGEPGARVESTAAPDASSPAAFHEQIASRLAAAQRQLADLALEVCPPAAPEAFEGSDALRDDPRAGRATYVHKALTNRLGFSAKPVEWLYSGLGPLFLGRVLETREGLPATLALLTASVCDRLGLDVAVEADTSGATLHAAQPPTASTAPPLNLLLHGFGEQDDLRLDPVTGEVSVYEAPPHLARVPKEDQPAFLVPGACAALVRQALLAHTRRGDSDAVAHTLYQVLALDPAAPEWGAALQGVALSPAERARLRPGG